jgi:hypothetical protein
MRRPCARCRRPTPRAALVEAHLPPPATTRPSWWLAADRVVWLCPACAAPLFQPAAPARVRGGHPRP